jgi:hypothetical protein
LPEQHQELFYLNVPSRAILAATERPLVV